MEAIAIKHHNFDFDNLKKPFPPQDIEWRVQQAGSSNGKPWAMVLAYLTNRAIQDRLDDVIGPQNWKNEFKEGPDGGILCGISIRVGDEWITKWDGAGNTQVEAVKGGLSSAMKRTAVQWGIGRYLYNLDATFANVAQNGKYYQKKGKNYPAFKWNPPQLPAWAMPQQQKPDNVLPMKPKQTPDAPQNQFQPIPPETHRDLEARLTKLSTLYGLNHTEYRNRVKGWAANYWKIPAENFHFNTSLNMPMFKELWLKLEGFAKKFSSEIQEKRYSRPTETWNDKPRADKSHGDTMQCESCADDKTGFCPRCELINSYPINNENVIKAPLELSEDEKTLLFDQSVKKNAIACSGACGRVWLQGLSRGSKIQNGSQVIPWKMTGGGISDKPEQFFCFECWQKIQEQKKQYKQ